MKHFTISEMLRSDTARKHGIWNGATKEHEENLKALEAEWMEQEAGTQTMRTFHSVGVA